MSYNQLAKSGFAGVRADMKKLAYIFSTVFLMLVTSRFIIRVIDATVQIDGDIGILILLLVILNATIGFLSYKLYKKTKRK